MQDDKKPTEGAVPEPVVINPDGQKPAEQEAVKKAVLETPALDMSEAQETPATVEAKQPEIIQPASAEEKSGVAQPAAVNPTTPVVEQATQAAAPVSATPEPTKTKKPKMFMQKSFLVIVMAGFFVIGGGAAAYLTVFQKSPEDIWKSALSNSANGLDRFVKLSSRKTSDSAKLDGKFKVTEPLAINATFSGQIDAENGNSQFDVGLETSGVSIDAEVRTVAGSSETPELYFKLKGLESAIPLLSLLSGADAAGAGDQTELFTSLIGGISNQWYVVDNSLLSGISGQDTSTPIISYTEEEIKKVGESIAAVMRDRLLSAEEDKAVFVLDEKIGKEKFEDTNTYKYKVKVNKENLKSFVTALKDSLKDTVLEKAILSSGSVDSLDEALDLEEMMKEIDDSDIDDLYAHVWAEANGNFIRNIRIYPFDSGEGSDYMDFSLDYKGGDVLPFAISVVQDNDDSSGKASFGLDFNQSNADTSIWFDLDIESAGTKIVGEGSLSVATTDDAVSVEAPVGAKSVTELLSVFLGGESLESTPSSIYPSFYDDFEL